MSVGFPNSPRLEGVEIARGFAAFLVVCFHATVTMDLPKYFGELPLGGALSFGYAGVDFFFVLSGFIIYYSTFKRHGQLGEVVRYFKQRLIRIYRVYWGVALFLLPLSFFMGHAVSLSNVLKDLALWPHEGYPFVVVAWTLRHEMLFYLSFVLFFVNVWLAWGYFFIWGALIVAAQFVQLDQSAALISLYLNDHNLEFLFGIVVAWYIRRDAGRVGNGGWLFLIGAAVFLAAGGFESLVQKSLNPVDDRSHYHLLYGVGAFCMLLGLPRIRIDTAGIFAKLGLFLGRASYSIYLIHFAVISAVIKLLTRIHIPLWLDFTLLVQSGVLVGALLYQFVEQPLLMRLRNRYLKEEL